MLPEPDTVEIDLVFALDLACSDLAKLARFADRFLSNNPEWMQAAHEAAQKYFNDLADMQLDDHSDQTAQQLGLSPEQILLANRLSLATLLGYSHYLQWAGFDIGEPTKFEEVSKKLAFARNVIARIGFSLALRMDSERQPPLPAQLLLSCYETGFSMGVVLGYLTVEACQKGSEAVLDLLEQSSL